MRHRVRTFKIGRSSAHRKAMLANMVSSLIDSGTIKTTVVKAKEASRFADRMVTLGKKGTLHHRRLAVSYLRNKDAVKKLFDEIAPTFAERAGGYTRVIRLGFRQGDGAEMCMLQLTNNDVQEKKTKKAAPKKAEKVEKAEKAEKTEKAETPAKEKKAAAPRKKAAPKKAEKVEKAEAPVKEEKSADS